MLHDQRRHRFSLPLVRLIMAAPFILVLLAEAPTGSAADVPEGTMLNKENLSTLAEQTFAGHAIGEMLADRIKWQIESQGLELRLVPTKPYPVDPRFAAATERYAGEVTFDPETKRISGWKAGLAFPHVDPRDPDAATKIIWNVTHGRNRGDIIHNPGEVILLIERNAGLERFQHWTFTRYAMKGILRVPDQPIEGDGSILAKGLFFALSPQDIKGVGTFTIYYDTGKLNDSWAYVRDVRRIRRLSGSSWMDLVSGTDWLNDDFSAFSAHPTWYKSYRLLGRKPILVVANSRKPTQITEAASPGERFPRIDLARPPHWNVVDDWEPRDVFIVEAVPPDEHPYSRKVLYVDAQDFVPYLTEMYDKSGTHWKTQILGQTVRPTEDDVTQWVVHEAYDCTADYLKGHATAYIAAPEVKINPPIRSEDVSLSVLEAVGR